MPLFPATHATRHWKSRPLDFRTQAHPANVCRQHLPTEPLGFERPPAAASLPDTRSCIPACTPLCPPPTLSRTALCHQGGDVNGTMLTAARPQETPECLPCSPGSLSLGRAISHVVGTLMQPYRENLVARNGDLQIASHRAPATGLTGDPETETPS